MTIDSYFWKALIYIADAYLNGNALWLHLTGQESQLHKKMVHRKFGNSFSLALKEAFLFCWSYIIILLTLKKVTVMYLIRSWRCRFAIRLRMWWCVSRSNAHLSVQHCVCLQLILPVGQMWVPVSGWKYSQLMVYEVIKKPGGGRMQCRYYYQIRFLEGNLYSKTIHATIWFF